MPTIKLIIPEVLLQWDITRTLSYLLLSACILSLTSLTVTPATNYNILYDLTSAEDLTPVQSTMSHSLATLHG